MLGEYQNTIDVLPDLKNYRYENIFKLYQTGDKNFYFYNIIKTISIPDDIDPEIFDFITLPSPLPLTSLSYDIYGTQHLWWLILIVNNIDDPIKKVPHGEEIRIVKSKYVDDVIDSITRQLQ
jgi:hypothetical protein